MSLINLGLTCVRPSAISDGLVTQTCPNTVVIDLDTARLGLSGDTNAVRLILSPRCVPCDAYLKITQLLEGHRLKMHAENIVCMTPGCDQQSFHTSGMCRRHLSSLLLDASREKVSTLSTPFLKAREAFESAARKQWVYPLKYDRVLRRMDEILLNKCRDLYLVYIRVDCSFI